MIHQALSLPFLDSQLPTGINTIIEIGTNNGYAEEIIYILISKMQLKLSYNSISPKMFPYHALEKYLNTLPTYSLIKILTLVGKLSQHFYVVCKRRKMELLF